MIKVIVPAAAALAVNVTAGLLLSAYPLMNMLFTSLAIAVNTLLVACSSASVRKVPTG